jgi:hypothetical protein
MAPTVKRNLGKPRLPSLQGFEGVSGLMGYFGKHVGQPNGLRVLARE